MDIDPNFPGFKKRYKERANKALKKKTVKAFELFRKNPYDPKLQLGEKIGDLAGFHDIHIDDDYRVILKIKRIGRRMTATCVNFGNHEQLYVHATYEDRQGEHYYM